MNRSNPELEHNEYFKTIKKEFIIFLLKEQGGIYPIVETYIRRTWKRNIYQFLNDTVMDVKPQNLLNIAFNFYNTQEGYNYWGRISKEWGMIVQRSYSIRKAIQNQKIRRK